jgi:hypothetical protein
MYSEYKQNNLFSIYFELIYGEWLYNYEISYAIPAEDFKLLFLHKLWVFFLVPFLFETLLSFMEKRCRAERKLDGYFLKILCYSLKLRSLKTVVTQLWVLFFVVFF